MITTIFDCETTGKLTPEGRIIETSFRVCDLTTFTEKKNVLIRINPERNIEAAAVKVHGISNDDVKGLPTFDTHLSTITEILNNTDYLVAHNLDSFDLPYLRQEFQRYGQELPTFKTFDTMVRGTFSTDLGKSPSLPELCFSLDIEFDPSRAHSGDYDTLVLRDAFFAGVRLGWFKLD